MATKKIDGVTKSDLWYTTPNRIKVVVGFNHRKDFDREKLNELKESIREWGICTPLLVRRDRTNKEQPFLLIAGERRLRAASDLQKEGLDIKLPLRIMSVNEEEAFAISVDENLNRDGLSLMEQAGAVQTLLRYGNSPAEVARKLSRPASWVSDMQTFLSLPNVVQKAADTGQITVQTAIKVARKVSPTQQESVVTEAVREANGNRSVAGDLIDQNTGYIKRPGKRLMKSDIDLVDRYRETFANGETITVQNASELVSLALKYGVGQVGRKTFIDTLSQHFPVA